jgi:hypothetical protein
MLSLFLKIFRKKRQPPEPIKAGPPPWDVPLDQTEAPMHFEGVSPRLVTLLGPRFLRGPG